MQVVEHQHERLGRGEQLEQLAHGAVAAVALVLQRRRPRAPRPRATGSTCAELGADVVVERVEPPRLEPLDVLVERVDEDPERQVALELRRASRRARGARARRRARPSSASRRVLPIPGSPTQLERAERPALELGERRDRARPSSAARPTRWSASTAMPSASISQARTTHEIRVAPRCRRAPRGDMLAACRATSSTTGTSRTSAASCSPPSRATRARCATGDARLVPLRRPRDLVDGGGAAAKREALGLLPFYVAERTTATRVSEVEIP